jgi:hypothetical protein
MALFGLPLASLILGVPLGVDLAYLNAAANKTGTSGTSQIAASGIRLELIQALKEEYAAFAAIDRAVVEQALKDEKETWENELYKEEDPTLGSRALGALGTLIAAPVALPVAAAAYGTRKLIALIKSRAAAKRAAAEAATAAGAPNAGALVIKADAAAKVAAAAEAEGKAAETDSGKAAGLLAKLKDWFKSNPEYNADGDIQAPVNNPFVNPAAPEAAAPAAASANMFGPPTGSAAEVNPFAPPPDPSMNWANGPAAPASGFSTPGASADVAPAAAAVDDENPFLAEAAPAAAPAAPAARGLFSFLSRPGASVAPAPVDAAAAALPAAPAPVDPEAAAALEAERARLVAEAAAQKKLDDLWAAVRDPVLWKGGFFRRGASGEALYDAVPSETRKFARDPASRNTLLAEAAANLNVPAFKFLVVQDDMAPLITLESNAGTVFQIVLKAPASREILKGNRKIAALGTLRSNVYGVRGGGKHRRRKTSRKMKGGANDREEIATALVARAKQRLFLGDTTICLAVAAALDTNVADKDPVYAMYKELSKVCPSAEAPAPAAAPAAAAPVAAAPLFALPSQPPPQGERVSAFQSAPLLPLPLLPAPPPAAALPPPPPPAAPAFVAPAPSAEPAAPAAPAAPAPSPAVAASVGFDISKVPRRALNEMVKEKTEAVRFADRKRAAAAEAAAAKVSGAPISFEVFTLLDYEDKLGWKENEVKRKSYTGPNGRDEIDVYDYKFLPTEAEKIQILQRQADADAPEARQEQEVLDARNAAVIANLQNQAAADASAAEKEKQLTEAGNAAENQRAASALAAVVPSAAAALANGVPLPPGPSSVKAPVPAAVVPEGALAAQTPSQASSTPTPAASAAEICSPTAYLEKRTALISALESKANFARIPSLWKEFVDTCLLGNSPPMPVALEWAAALQNPAKQRAALENLVATLKKMDVLNDGLEAEIIQRWTNSSGGKRRRRKTPKRRRVGKARNSTFRRHRKH